MSALSSGERWKALSFSLREVTGTVVAIIDVLAASGDEPGAQHVRLQDAASRLVSLVEDIADVLDQAVADGVPAPGGVGHADPARSCTLVEVFGDSGAAGLCPSRPNDPEEASSVRKRLAALVRPHGGAETVPVASPRSGTIRCGDLIVDLDAHQVSSGDRSVRLPLQLIRLLSVLAANPSRSLSPSQLRAAAWGSEDGSKAAVYSAIHRLRRTIEGDLRSGTSIERSSTYLLEPKPGAMERSAPDPTANKSASLERE